MFRDIYKHYFSVLHFKIGPLLFKIEGVSVFSLQACPEKKNKKSFVHLEIIDSLLKLKFFYFFYFL